jgi:hypothetical protein
MSHFAQIDENNVVVQVIVAEQEFINTGVVGDPASWIQTSYNTQGGQHQLGGTPLRKNYAGIGYTYDPVRDAFIPPQPYPSWTLDEETCLWSSPQPHPRDGKIYSWSEDALQWLEIIEGTQPEQQLSIE